MVDWIILVLIRGPINAMAVPIVKRTASTYALDGGVMLKLLWLLWQMLLAQMMLLLFVLLSMLMMCMMLYMNYMT